MRVLRLAFMLTVQETASPGCSDLAWDEMKKQRGNVYRRFNVYHRFYLITLLGGFGVQEKDK